MTRRRRVYQRKRINRERRKLRFNSMWVPLDPPWGPRHGRRK